jgi:hypothetical protein
MAKRPTFQAARVHVPSVKTAPAKLTAQLLERYRERFVAGEQEALLIAIDACASTGMVMPPWIVRAFRERFMAWHSFRAETLDEAFKVERKGVRSEERAQHVRLRPEIARRVLKLREEGVRGNDLWKRVCLGLGIKPGNAKDIFYHADTVPIRRVIAAILKMPKGPPQKF